MYVCLLLQDFLGHLEFLRLYIAYPGNVTNVYVVHRQILMFLVQQYVYVYMYAYYGNPVRPDVRLCTYRSVGTVNGTVYAFILELHG